MRTCFTSNLQYLESSSTWGRIQPFNMLSFSSSVLYIFKFFYLVVTGIVSSEAMVLFWFEMSPILRVVHELEDGQRKWICRRILHQDKLFRRDRRHGNYIWQTSPKITQSMPTIFASNFIVKYLVLTVTLIFGFSEYIVVFYLYTFVGEHHNK